MNNFTFALSDVSFISIADLFLANYSSWFGRPQCVVKRRDSQKALLRMKHERAVQLCRHFTSMSQQPELNEDSFLAGSE
jgi:hypothetical protein